MWAAANDLAAGAILAARIEPTVAATSAAPTCRTGQTNSMAVKDRTGDLVGRSAQPGKTTPMAARRPSAKIMPEPMTVLNRISVVANVRIGATALTEKGPTVKTMPEPITARIGISAVAKVRIGKTILIVKDPAAVMTLIGNVLIAKTTQAPMVDPIARDAAMTTRWPILTRTRKIGATIDRMTGNPTPIETPLVAGCAESDYRRAGTQQNQGWDHENFRVLVWAAALSLGFAPLASGQADFNAYYTVGDYTGQSADQQVGYTTGLVDFFNWLVSGAPETGDMARAEACLVEKGNVDVSIMFDTYVAGGAFAEFGAAEVFVAMINDTCGTNVTNEIALGGGGGGVGAANGNCVSIATLPNGLLVDLTRTGQLAALYAEGAFC